MSITTQVLLTIFATLTPPTENVSDLCDIVHPDTGRPVYCEPHPDGAPLFDGLVCCEDQTCFDGRDGDCLTAEEPYYCELGLIHASSEVTCYFEVPSFCEVFPCDPGYQAVPQANIMCCNNGICWNTYSDLNDCELADIYWCSDGVTNNDGTVTCFD